MVEPVVVKPDTASNIESTTDNGCCPNIKGREQITGQNHQSKFTTIIPNLADTLGVSPLEARAISKHTTLEVVADQKKPSPPVQPKITDAIHGRYIKTEKTKPARETIWQAARNSLDSILI